MDVAPEVECDLSSLLLGVTWLTAGVFVPSFSWPSCDGPVSCDPRGAFCTQVVCVEGPRFWMSQGQVIDLSAWGWADH